MEISESKSYRDIDYEKQFSKDKKFLKNYEYNNETLEQDRQRFLEIATRWDCFESEEGKYCLLAAEAYTALNKAVYRKGIIRNLEFYLNLKLSDEEVRNAVIPLRISTFQTLKSDAELSKKVHLQQIYYLLARAYEQENDIENAFRCIEKGIALYPINKSTFDLIMFNCYKKSNRLPEFVKYCKSVEKEGDNWLAEMKKWAENLIKEGYVFKARKKK